MPAHRYSSDTAFTRLMLLIATFVHYPGIGCPKAKTAEEHEPHNALEDVQVRMQELAESYGIKLKHCSIPTLRKDLETLREYGLLERRMYRWGYYLGTGVLAEDELHVALNALASQAHYQREPEAKKIYQQLQKRLRGFGREGENRIFYPVRQQLNRAIAFTDVEEMLSVQQNQDNLFHQWEQLVDAIASGRAVELSRRSDPYKQENVGRVQVFPLQLFYYDIAWYLIHEDCQSQHLAVGRVDRFYNYCQTLETQRGLEQQQRRLKEAQKLLRQGWGLNLGGREEQQAELKGKLPFETVKVRFFEPVIAFIQEGTCRHPSQKIHIFRERKTEQKVLDYTVKLPPRSLPEFSLWIFRFMENAKVLKPDALVEKHRASAQAVWERYQD